VKCASGACATVIFLCSEVKRSGNQPDMIDANKLFEFLELLIMNRNFRSVAKNIGVTGLVCALYLGIPSGGPAELLAADNTNPGAASVTPDVQLVIDYNDFIQSTFTDWQKQKPGLPKFITNKTILHEAPSLPWGGTMVGFAGWHQLYSRNIAVMKALLPHLEIADSTYFQNGTTVIHEYGMVIKATSEAPEPFVMGMIEKYTVKDGRIAQIDEFYEDTAGLLKRLAVLGIVNHPPR
jgi:ketosteroid isomerase-like protein